MRVLIKVITGVVTSVVCSFLLSFCHPSRYFAGYPQVVGVFLGGALAGLLCGRWGSQVGGIVTAYFVGWHLHILLFISPPGDLIPISRDLSVFVFWFLAGIFGGQLGEKISPFKGQHKHPSAMTE